MTQPKVTRVRGEVLHKGTRAGAGTGLPSAPPGYRYTAVLKDGTEVIIRAKVAHRYEWAYLWVSRMARRKGEGLAAHFTYSNFPVTSPGALARFRIEWL